MIDILILKNIEVVHLTESLKTLLWSEARPGLKSHSVFLSPSFFLERLKRVHKPFADSRKKTKVPQLFCTFVLILNFTWN